MKKVCSLCIVIALLSMIALSGCDKFLKIVTVKTLPATDMTSVSVTMNGQVVSDGGGAISERGFFYSTSKSLKNPVEVPCGAGGEGNFDAKITGLQPNTTYYFQAYAKSADDMDVGDILEFTTFELGLTVETLQPEVVSAENVILKGKFDNKDILTVTRLGFEYDKHGDYSRSTKVYVEGINADFSASVSLDANTSYYCRAFAETSDSTIVVYGEDVVFSTRNENDVPVVTTGTYQLDVDYDITKVRVSGTVSYSGDINSKGFYYSKNADMSEPMEKWAGAGIGDGNFTAILEGLDEGTTYYYKAVVKYQRVDQQVEACGDVKSFRTNVAAE